MSKPAAGPASVASVEDLELLARLRRGDEAAFAELVRRLYGPMLRLAMVHVGNRAVAEEVVQDAWVGVLRQLDRFEGRSSLRTWVLRIVGNRAKTWAVRERRTAPFSSFVLLLRRARGARRSGGRAGAVPARGRAVGRTLGVAAAPMGRRARGPAAVARDPGRGRAGR